MLVWQQKVDVTLYPDATSATDLHPETAIIVGNCISKDGGGSTGETAYVRPGAMAPGVAMPGPSGFDVLTLHRWIQHGVDSGLYQRMQSVQGCRVQVVAQPLDAKRNAGFHRPIIHSGVLGNVNPPAYDPASTDAQVIEFTVQPDSVS